MIRNRYIGAITDKPWWLAGGIPQSACVAAYKPVWAASIAASYVNLASPGTNNAAPGTAPTWDAANGWKFLRASSQWLDTGILPTATTSMIAKFSNGTSSYSLLIASYSGNDVTRFGIVFVANNNHYYDHAGELTIGGGSPTSGVYAVSGQQGYANGVPDGGTIPGTWSGKATKTIGIGLQNGNTGAYSTFYLQAVAFYSETISAAQIVALTNAMNAL